MAEWVKSQSIRDGSDADLEFTCSPCREGSVVQEAVKYCPECQEYLCKSCAIHHGRFKATRSHKLTNVENVHEGVMLLEVAKCLYHPDRAVEMYCSDHDMVYCTMCIATEHRSCSGVSKIEQSVKSFNYGQHEFNTLETEMKTILDNLQATNQKKQENVGTLEKDREEINGKIQKMENTLTEYIQKLKTSAVSALDARHDEARSEIESDVSATLDMIENIQKMTKLSKVAKDTDALQQFVMMKLMHKTANDAKKLHDQKKSSSVTLCFKENEDLSSVLKAHATLGEVIATGRRRDKGTCKGKQTKLATVEEVNVKMKTDTKSGEILDACQIPDGTVILADHTNKKIKRLDNNYTVRDSCVLDASPTAVCCTGPDTIAVKTDNNTIQFIIVGSSLSVQNHISITNGRICGLAYCFEQLWVSVGYSGVKVYNKVGKLLKSINQIPFKDCTQHIAVGGTTVYVTDYTDGVVCFDTHGTVIKQLRDTRLKHSRGVCVSTDGIVFLSGFNSKNIVMFSREGECLGELTKDLKEPLSLCYDKKKNSIIVTGKDSIISILDLSE